MSSQNVFDPTNIVILPATVVGTFRYADWKGAYRRSGTLGVIGELAQSAVGTNTMPFFIPVNSEWPIQDVQALLLRYGIELWGVGYWNGEMYFRVKKRQAHWAQYVMLREGVPLLHGLLPGTRAIPSPASAGSNASGRETGEGFLDWITGLFL